MGFALIIDVTTVPYPSYHDHFHSIHAQYIHHRHYALIVGSIDLLRVTPINRPIDFSFGIGLITSDDLLTFIIDDMSTNCNGL